MACSRRRGGTVINGTRTRLAPTTEAVTAQQTIGKSRYNALELNLRYTSARGSILAGYTYSKSMDTSSNLGEQVNPFDADATRRRRRSTCATTSSSATTTTFPFDVIFGRRNALTTGWTISGVTRFSSGFPVTLYNDTDTSLLGTFGNGVNNHLLDTPDYAPGCDLKINHDPANGAAFNTACFSLPVARPARQRAAAVFLRARH